MAARSSETHRAGRSGVVLVAHRDRAVADALGRTLVARGVDAVAVDLTPEAVVTRLAEGPVAVLVLGHPSRDVIDACQRTDRSLRILTLAPAEGASDTTPAASVPAGVRHVPWSTSVDHLVRILEDLPPQRRPTLGRGAAVPSERGDPLERLTAREDEVLRQLLQGADVDRIAVTLGISPHTVRTHLQSIYVKLGVHNQLQAALVGLRAGLRVREVGSVEGDVA